MRPVDLNPITVAEAMHAKVQKAALERAKKRATWNDATAEETIDFLADAVIASPQLAASVLANTDRWILERLVQLAALKLRTARLEKSTAEIERDAAREEIAWLTDAAEDAIDEAAEGELPS